MTAGAAARAAPDPAATAAAILIAADPASHLTRWLPASVDGLGADTLAAAQALVDRAMSPTTVKTYGSGLADWARWCLAHGLPPLPADPLHVACYLAEILDATSLVPLGAGPAGAPRRRVRPVTAQRHLSAINKAHDVAGHPRPGADPVVVAVMRGARREFGTRAETAKDAVDLALLRRLVAAARTDPRRTRDTLAVALCAALPRQAERRGRGGAPVTLTDLAGLRAAHVALVPGAVVLALPGRDPLALPATGRPACPRAAADAALRLFGDDGPLLPGTVRPRPPYGRTVTRPGLAALVRRLARAAEARLPDADPLGLDPADADRLLGGLGTPTAVLRDTAVLTIGWFGALRRSSLSALDARDVADEGTHLAVAVRRVKSDPNGAGTDLALPDTADPALSPVLAWRAWTRRLADLGVDLDRPGTPALCRVGRDDLPTTGPDGRAPQRLAGDGVLDVVRDLCARAGLDPGRFGAHSLRSGFVTEALATQGVTLADVQRVTGHRTVEMLMRYDRPRQRRATHPGLRMAA